MSSLAPSTRLVNRAASAIERRSSRRGFLRRSALVGSAVVAAPTDFVLRPGTAYAAICNCNGSSCQCGSQCCDGYTEFCCTINGTNGCPPGTLYGGWWKADGSGYCGTPAGPAPRYYLDCNAPCGDCGCGPSGVCSGSCSGTPCGCANGSCGNRKAGCTGFRYGQCNQDVACLGPIVCRVVTCALPWELDSSCSTTVRTDSNTRFHNAACLQLDPGDPVGSLESVELAPGGFRLVGWVLASAPNEVRLSAGTSLFADVVANKSAADVGRTEPSGAAVRWFDGVVKTPNGRTVVCASVVDGGRLRSIGCEQVVFAGHKPFGMLESVHGGPGLVRVVGWAIDPDVAGPVNLKISVDGTFVRKIKARRVRKDVAEEHPNFGTRHGFDVEIEATDGSQICVYAMNRKAGRGSTLLGCATATLRTGSPFGSLDFVQQVPGGVAVKGWAIDPDLDGPAQVDIRIDGVTVKSVQAGKRRRDIGRVYPGYGNLHGFSEVVPVPAGSHEICVRARDVGPGRTRTLGCETLNVTSSLPTGGIDNVTVLSGRLEVSGWALDQDTLGPIDVELVIDGNLAGQMTAGIARQDVESAFPAHGANHGYFFGVDVSPGAHTVCITALDNNNEGASSLGCRDVVVP